jgi:hypothetical protein
MLSGSWEEAAEPLREIEAANPHPDAARSNVAAEKALMGTEQPGTAAETKPLVPVFIPSLAALLAHAESSKGMRLTETEALRVRNNAVCMMMAPDDAAKLAESRGYRDVEPENCWADWHRLRVQITGNGYLPKLILCILGDADLETRCRHLLDGEGIEHEWRERDDRMESAFPASVCRCDPSLMADDFARIVEHSRVLYLLSPNFTAEDGPNVGRRFLCLGRRLLEAGALAMKCESSGIAHGRARWHELARDAEGADSWTALVRGYVQLPIWNGEDYHTCGLHLLGQPDLIVSGSVLREASDPTRDPAWTAVDLFRIFANYLLAECTPGRFASGHTFSPDAASPRFRVFWEDCTGYEEDEFFFNPFGRWRFAEFVK